MMGLPDILFKNSGIVYPVKFFLYHLTGVATSLYVVPIKTSSAYMLSAFSFELLLCLPLQAQVLVSVYRGVIKFLTSPE